MTKRREPDAPSIQENMLDQASGARQAAAKYGFNPLTMLQYGQTAGTVGSGTPLASQELIASGIQQFADVASGEAERRYASNELQADLGRIALEQQRALVAVRPSASAAVNNGVPGLGNRPAAYVAQKPLPGRPPLGGPGTFDWLTAGRPQIIKPEENLSSFMTVENGLTFGPTKVLGSDGEVMGPLEVAMLGAQVAPQAYWNWSSSDLNPFQRWLRELNTPGPRVPYDAQPYRENTEMRSNMFNPPARILQ